MTGRPYRSRRRRRCAYPLCLHSGVIEPGQLAIRTAQHRYEHATDRTAAAALVEIGKAIRSTYEAFTQAMAAVMGPLVDWARTIVDAVLPVADGIAAEVHVDAVDRCWALPVTVARVPGLAVRVAPDAGEPFGGRLALDRAGWALEDGGYTIDRQPDHLLATWHPTFAVDDDLDGSWADAHVMTFADGDPLEELLP